MPRQFAIAAAALVAAAILVPPAAGAAPGAALKGAVESVAAEPVHYRKRDRSDRHRRHRHRSERRSHKRHEWRGHRSLRNYSRLRHYGFRRFGQVRWDGYAFVLRAWHPRYGWCWVRVSARSGRPLAFWY